MTGRAGRTARWLGARVRSAPGTHLWLLVLAGTSVAVARMSPEFREWFLRRRSTNLDQLATHPVRALVVSALWNQRPAFLLDLGLFELFVAPAERWLGTRRWLAVIAVSHGGASVLSQVAVARGIQRGLLPASLATALDVGVSYAVAGAAGVLTHRVARPWNRLYLAVALVVLLAPLASSPTFTDLGHAAAFLLGFACLPLTRGRPRRDPRDAVRALRRAPSRGGRTTEPGAHRPADAGHEAPPGR